MKITSLTLQAFRGFNKKENFLFESADIIVLYGPNGHGKSSVYDAIEWSLTGGIHRFDEASPERRRTRFIRNLHAISEDRSFVELGIILSSGKRFIIERECTASVSERTDYGKHKLRIFDEKGQLHEENEDAERILKSWLIHEEWLPKISSPTTMLSLTHILSQEKIAEFLMGMQERDRYDAISTIFGTDYFDKYREGFRIVRNTLNSEIEKIKVEIKGKGLIRDKLQSEINTLELKVEKDENTDFNIELEQYVNIYPEVKVNKNDLAKLLKSIHSNKQAIGIEREKLEKNHLLLGEIKKELPKLAYIRKVHKAILQEQQLVQKFKKLSHTKMKIEELQSMEQVVNDDRITLESLMNLQKDFSLKISSLLDKRESLLMVIESLSIHLDTFLWKNISGLSTEMKSRLPEKNYDILNDSFKCMFDESKFIEQQKSIQENQSIQLKAINESIKQIESTDEVYNTFLSSLNKYILVVSEELNNCPACGTDGIRSEDILNNVQKQQLKVNENLPRLQKLSLQTQFKLNEIDEEINSANVRIKKSKESVREVLYILNNTLKEIDINTSTEQQNQLTLQQKIDSLKLKLNQFEKECKLLGLEIKDNIRGELELKNQELIKKLSEINSMRILDSESINYLPDELKLEKYNIAIIDEHERALRQSIVKQETEIERVDRLAKLSENLIVDIKTADLDRAKINVIEEMEKLDQRLKKIADIELISINLQSMIELNTEKMRLIQLQKELTEMNNQVNYLEKKEINMNKDSAYLFDLMNKSTEALSNLNEKVFSNLKETIQTIFEQINSHPVFTKLDLVLDKYRNNNCLTINVSKGHGMNKVIANAPYVFSSAQVNSIALSLFLAMSLKQKWSSLQLIGMDDPIQSMDEVNIISFIDLMRLFVDKHKKQIIISTHDHSFYKMILKKFRYHNLTTIEYEAYGDKGPSIKMNDQDVHYNNKVQIDLNYEQAKEALLLLDTKE